MTLDDKAAFDELNELNAKFGHLSLIEGMRLLRVGEGQAKYAIALQRLIEAYCHGRELPDSALHHARMLVDKREAERAKVADLTRVLRQAGALVEAVARTNPIVTTARGAEYRNDFECGLCEAEAHGETAPDPYPHESWCPWLKCSDGSEAIAAELATDGEGTT